MTKREIRQILDNMSSGMADLIARDPRIIDFFNKNDITDSRTKKQIISWFAIATCGALVSGDANEDDVAKGILDLAAELTVDIEEELNEEFDDITPTLEKVFQECGQLWQQALANAMQSIEEEDE